MRRWGVFLGAALCLGALLGAGGLFAGPDPGAERATYVGSETCAGCHQDLAKEWGGLPHTQYLMAARREVEGKGCEECHGPGSKHAAGDTKAILRPRAVKAEQESRMCLQCHRDAVKAQDWHTAAHGKARLACSICHQVHHAAKGPKMLRQPVMELYLSCHPAQKAQLRQNSHHPVAEGRLSCLDCHNPHRAGGERATVQATNELCTTCHSEKAGPFVYEHEAVSGDTGDGCLTCHQSHGSPNQQLERVSGRGLCQQCHFDKVAHNPGRTCWTVGCHSEIHGSHQSELFLR